MRSILRLLISITALCAALEPAHAQLVDAYLGLGGVHDGSTHQQFNTFGDGALYSTDSLTGLVGDFGLGVMIGRHLGAGFDTAWRLPHGTYTGIAYRPTFYSFDGIYEPAFLTRKRFSPEVRVGIGGAGLHFSSDQQQACVNGPACQSSAHFQVHLAAAARIYVTDHLFIRPALDIHAVHQFSEFASDIVAEYSVGVGYSLGRE